MRLIDADDLIELLQRQIRVASNDYELEHNFGISTAIQIVSKSPTVIEKNKFGVYVKADKLIEELNEAQVEGDELPIVDDASIVRCKDCGRRRYCEWYSIYGCDENNFCSFARINETH